MQLINLGPLITFLLLVFNGDGIPEGFVIIAIVAVVNVVVAVVGVDVVI